MIIQSYSEPEARSSAPDIPSLSTRRNARTVVIAAALIVYLAASLFCILHFRPDNNEAWFANPAVDLTVRHKMGTPIIEGRGTWLAGIDQHTYWTLPLYTLVQLPWYGVLGFSLVTQRLLTLALGFGVLACVYLLVRKLSTPWAAALSLLLICCDLQFMERSAEGRMDMLCAFLGFAALALYSNLRETRFKTAILLANVAVAAACLTHPCGVLAMTALWAMVLYFDRKRLGWSGIGLTAIAYVVALLAWAPYISRDPHSFIAQLKGNTGGVQSAAEGKDRFGLLLHPLRAFSAEMHLRYFSSYHSHFIPLLYLAGLAALIVLAWKTRRRDHIVFAALGFLYFTELMVLDGLKMNFYLVYSIPVLAIALAVVVCSIELPSKRMTMIVAVLAVGLMVGLQFTTGYRNLQGSTGAADYFETASVIGSNHLPGEDLIAPAEFAYRFGFYQGLTDDWQIGYLTGKRPKMIVLGGLGRLSLNKHKSDDPAFSKFADQRLNQEYVLAFHNRSYQIYARRDSANFQTAAPDLRHVSLVKMVINLRPVR